MFKTATLISIGLCLMASGALADTGGQSDGMLTLASNSGLFVRVAATPMHRDITSRNVYGAAVNTGGVPRATSAVKVGGRVFLTSGYGRNVGPAHMATVTTNRRDTSLAMRSPVGLGTLLARIFGLHRS